ncbi:AAA family ATPase [Clavibacter nebraskensis]|uniref:AAA family ATPase n=1 Tax=Clavibacter nebraskensis TaxID=31963 RepID=UPI000345D194|nr:hypothetical protein VV38_05710 [Clavibacter nebraskensis]OAH22347.1 hypothetical protein A3Q38_02855 [Clavibacter nebraskensis]
MIRTLAVSGYRSVCDLALPLTGLDVVTGANGSGTTNVYRALRLIAGMAQGGAVGALAREGGLEAVLWAGPRACRAPCAGVMSLGFEQPGILRVLDAAELSDGTLRMLMLTAALLTTETPEPMVLNEPETSPHGETVLRGQGLLSAPSWDWARASERPAAHTTTPPGRGPGGRREREASGGAGCRDQRPNAADAGQSNGSPPAERPTRLR